MIPFRKVDFESDKCNGSPAIPDILACEEQEFRAKEGGQTSSVCFRSIDISQKATCYISTSDKLN